MSSEESLQAIRAQVQQCRACQLYAGRTRAVPGEGPAASLVMFIGEVFLAFLVSPAQFKKAEALVGALIESRGFEGRGRHRRARTVEFARPCIGQAEAAV